MCKTTLYAVLAVAISFGLVQWLRADLVKGSKLEVKVGDGWETVTVVRAERGRVLITGDDGRLEWVSADRLHAADSAELDKLFPPAVAPSKPATVSGSAPSQTIAHGAPLPASNSPTTTGSAAPPHPSPQSFQAGEAVQYETFGEWSPGHIVQVSVSWVLLTKDPPPNARRSPANPEMYWIESWAVRVPGSAYVMEGWGGYLHSADSKPSVPSGTGHQRPATSGDPFTVGPSNPNPTTQKTADSSSPNSSDRADDAGGSDVNAATMPSIDKNPTGYLDTGRPVTLDGPFTTVQIHRQDRPAKRVTVALGTTIAPPAKEFVDLTPASGFDIGDLDRILFSPDAPGIYIALGRRRDDTTSMLVLNINSPSASEVRRLTAKDHDVLAVADGANTTAPL